MRDYGPPGSFGFTRVQSCAHRGFRVHSDGGAFNQVRLGESLFILFRQVSLWRACWSPSFFRIWRGFIRARQRLAGFIRVREGSLCAPSRRHVHWRSRDITRDRLVFSGFMRVRVGSLWLDFGSQGSFWLAWVHSVAQSGRRGSLWLCLVHSGSRKFT